MVLAECDRRLVDGRVARDSLMLAAQRQFAILEQVRGRGAVRVAELAARFAVSDMTVRRDLDALAERGLLSKVHGGAVAAAPGAADEPGFAAKSVRQRPEKEAIAAAAARMVDRGAAVALSAGSTTAALARQLIGMPDLTVVTNSVPACDVLHGQPDQNVLLTGGIRTPSDALVGPLAVAALRNLHVDLLFLGVHGMSQQAGFTTPNVLEAETDQAMIAAAKRLVVLADHTKWDIAGMCAIAALAAADAVITDDGLPGDARAVLAENVGELVVVRA